MKKSKQIKIVIRFNVSSEFEQGIGEIKFGKFEIIPLPYKKFYLQRPEESEGLLVFKSCILPDNPNVIDHNIAEGNMILSWLSLLLRSNIKSNSARIKEYNVTLLPFRSTKEKIIKLPEDFNELYYKLNSFDKDTLSRYLRSCSFYNDAIDLIEINKMMSYILLVTSIECLTNSRDINAFQFLFNKINDKSINKIILKELEDEYYSKYGLKRNFMEFIKKYFSKMDEIEDLGGFEKLLSSVYDIRSEYLHAGKDFTKQLMITDRLGIDYFVSYKEKAKKIISPGTFWFESIVHDVLLNFLRKQEVKRKKRNLEELAVEAIKERIKLNMPVEKGDDIKKNHINLEL